MKPQSLFQPMLYWLVGLILIGGVSACALPAQTPTVEMTVEAILTLSGPTTTPIPTRTPIREATATPTSTSTTTLQPAITDDPSLITPPPVITPDQIQTLISPDGQWLAEVSVRPEGHQYHTVFVITKPDGSSAWIIVDEYWQGLGASTPEILSWSNDGRYLYFAEVGSPDGGCDLFGWSSVHQVDVTTGKVAPVNWPSGRDYALSPDDTTVAYFASDQPLSLALYDVKTRITREVRLPITNTTTVDIQTGGIVWSADGQGLALTIAFGLCQEAPTFSVIKVDTQTLAPSLVITAERRLLKVLEWPEPDKMLVRDWDQKSWWVDAATGEATTAPQPALTGDASSEVKPTQKPLTSAEDRAPNGGWSAQGWGEFRGETYHAEMRVTRADGQVKWIASQEFNAGLGVPVPTPLEWSEDGRYLYYTNVPLVDGYVCSIPVNGSDLWRMDLTDGRVSQRVPEVGLSVSLSPDEKTFAYVSFGQQQDLVLRDLATGGERRVSLPANTRSGGIVWSLDSSVLMLTVATQPCSANAQHSIVQVDVATLEQTKMSIDYKIHWVTLAWSPDGLNLRHDGASVDRWFPTFDELNERHILMTEPSPNQKWLALPLDRTSELVELAVVRADGSQIWIVAQGYPYEAGLIPLRWSPDGRFLYFTLLPFSDGGCFPRSSSGTNIQRLDLETGQVSELMQGDAGVMSISPNTKWLAYLEGETLVFHDLTTGDEQRMVTTIYELGDDIGNLVWSPDSNSLMMTAITNSCWTGSFSIVRFDRLTLTQTDLIHEAAHELSIVAWTDEQTVWLNTRVWEGESNFLTMNPLTGELTIPTIVPQNLSPN